MERPDIHHGVRELAPFLAASVVAFLTLPLPPDTGAQVGHVASAALVILAAGLVAWLAIRRDFNPWMGAVPAYLYLVAVALLRDAEGGAPSGFGMLVLLSLTWLALHAGRAQLLLGIALMAAMFAVPILIVGEPGYPASEWRRMLLWVTVGWIAASTMQALVVRVRAQATAADRRARTDQLTQLPNRRELEDVLERELARAADRGLTLSLAMVDIDHFKAYNDSKGHAAGDELLRDAAIAWRAAIRSSDVLARYGGEEFTLVLPGCPLEQAIELADRLRMATPHGQTCSVGVAEWNGRESLDALFARADELLYDAKHQGRDRVVA